MPWEEAERLLARMTDPSLPVEAQLVGEHGPALSSEALPRVMAGLGSGHVVPDVGWPGVVPCGFCLSPFQSSTPQSEPGLEA